jgi:hypothetical protein
MLWTCMLVFLSVYFQSPLWDASKCSFSPSDLLALSLVFCTLPFSITLRYNIFFSAKDGMQGLGHARRALFHWATSPAPFFCGIGVWTRGLMLATQVLHHLNHSPALFCFSHFSGRILHFCSELASNCAPPTYDLPATTGMHNHSWLIDWDRGLNNFVCPGWPQTMILPISASLVAGITGAHAQPTACGFFDIRLLLCSPG